MFNRDEIYEINISYRMPQQNLRFLSFIDEMVKQQHSCMFPFTKCSSDTDAVIRQRNIGFTEKEQKNSKEKKKKRQKRYEDHFEGYVDFVELTKSAIKRNTTERLQLPEWISK